jgi:hypothetical protein
MAPTEIHALARIMGELDYYQLLHLKSDASPRDVKLAFHASSRVFHPDANRHLDDELRSAVAEIAKPTPSRPLLQHHWHWFVIGSRILSRNSLNHCPVCIADIRLDLNRLRNVHRQILKFRHFQSLAFLWSKIDLPYVTHW